MTTFIQEVIFDLQKKEKDFSKLIFILPSRRAGTLLERTIAATLYETLFAPTIYSIEEFIQNISGLQPTPPIELIFTFYRVYLDITPEKEQESFQTFITWAPILLDDINEVDRHLLDPLEIFNHLSAIKELDHWSNTAPTDLIKNHLNFWDKLPLYYSALSEKLISKNEGHQGLLYRKASEEIEFYINNNNTNHHVFLGFNALNTSEERIIQALLANGNSSIYWDTEKYFMDFPSHNAAIFLQKHRSKWKYFEKNKFNWIFDNFKTQKKINCTGVPQNIDQAKYVSKILASLDEKALNNTAVVLGDEGLIIPILNSLPQNVKNVNITMGIPLSQTPISAFFKNLFTLQVAHSDKGYYYKDILALLRNPLSKNIFNDITINNIAGYIAKYSTIYISSNELFKQSKEEFSKSAQQLFTPWGDNAITAIENTSSIITSLLKTVSYKKDILLTEYLQGFQRAFNKLKNLLDEFACIENISVLERLYDDILSKEVIDLRGNPHEGLQVMGMLESRVLDFKNVIMTSVNEGVLPSGKSSNSYLPYDIKVHYGLPTYKDKDAVYTYHFYRLLHRARNVEIIYTTTSSGLGSSEKSRLILQLETEGVHSIQHKIASSPVYKSIRTLESIPKTPEVQEKIKSFFKSGISPSAIGSYLKNPLDFYYQYILRVPRPDEIEETIASNTMGTIVHNVLENLYTPFKECIITEANIKALIKKSKSIVDYEFKKQNNHTKSQGQNFIIYEVICRFIENFLRMELHSIKSGATLKICSLEDRLITPLKDDSITFDINLKGTVDRVDMYNNKIRVIDYKTGTVEKSNLKIKDWKDLVAPEGKYEKAFQILLYAYMLNKKNSNIEPISAGIISIKKIQNGYMPFTIGKETQITKETLLDFKTVLLELIQEIMNPEIPFQDSGFSY